MGESGSELEFEEILQDRRHEKYIQGNSLIKDGSELYLVESEKLSLGGSKEQVKECGGKIIC